MKERISIDTCLVRRDPTRSTWLCLIGQLSTHSSGGGLAHPHEGVEMVGCPPLHACIAKDGVARPRPSVVDRAPGSLPHQSPSGFQTVSWLVERGKNGKNTRVSANGVAGTYAWPLPDEPSLVTGSGPHRQWSGAQRGRCLLSCGWSLCSSLTPSSTVPTLLV